MNNRKSILYDFDNLLVDTHSLWFKANRYALSQDGIELDEQQFIALEFGTDPKRLLEDLQLDSRNSDLFQQNRNNIYSTLLSKAAWIDGAENLLKEVANRNIPQGVVSHIRRENLVGLAHLKIETYFDVFLCQDDIHPKRKPHIHGLMKAANIIGSSLPRTVYIGDLSKDMQAASNAAMKGILIPNNLTENSARQYAWKIFPSLRECVSDLDNWLEELETD